MKALYYFLMMALLPLAAAGQASDSQDITLTVHFEIAIPVENIEVYYFDKGRSHFTNISYKVNKAENSITLKGTNDYIVGAAFPTLFFSIKDREVTEWGEVKKVANIYYLISKGRFNPEELPVINFEKQNANIYIENSGSKARIWAEPTGFGPQLPYQAGNKIYKVNQQLATVP